MDFSSQSFCNFFLVDYPFTVSRLLVVKSFGEIGKALSPDPYSALLRTPMFVAGDPYLVHHGQVQGSVSIG